MKSRDHRLKVLQYTIINTVVTKYCTILNAKYKQTLNFT